MGTLPTKEHWRDPSTVARIEQSLAELRAVTAGMRVALPRPGCSNGGLSWDAVRPLIAHYLPEPRFVVVSCAPRSLPA